MNEEIKISSADIGKSPLSAPPINKITINRRKIFIKGRQIG